MVWRFHRLLGLQQVLSYSHYPTLLPSQKPIQTSISHPQDVFHCKHLIPNTGLWALPAFQVVFFTTLKPQLPCVLKTTMVEEVEHGSKPRTPRWYPQADWKNMFFEPLIKGLVPFHHRFSSGFRLKNLPCHRRTRWWEGILTNPWRAGSWQWPLRSSSPMLSQGGRINGLPLALHHNIIHSCHFSTVSKKNGWNLSLVAR